MLIWICGFWHTVSLSTDTDYNTVTADLLLSGDFVCLVPGPVKALRNVTRTSNAIRLMWSAPEKTNGQLKYYQVWSPFSDKVKAQKTVAWTETEPGTGKTVAWFIHGLDRRIDCWSFLSLLRHQYFFPVILLVQCPSLVISCIDVAQPSTFHKGKNNHIINTFSKMQLVSISSWQISQQKVYNRTETQRPEYVPYVTKKGVPIKHLVGNALPSSFIGLWLVY